MFNEKILEDNLVKIYLHCLQNRTLSYKFMSSKQTYPKFKNKKEIMTLDKENTSWHVQSACDEARLVCVYAYIYTYTHYL